MINKQMSHHSGVTTAESQHGKVKAPAGQTNGASDANTCLVNFYSSIAAGEITRNNLMKLKKIVLLTKAKFCFR